REMSRHSLRSLLLQKWANWASVVERVNRLAESPKLPTCSGLCSPPGSFSKGLFLAKPGIRAAMSLENVVKPTAEMAFGNSHLRMLSCQSRQTKLILCAMIQPISRTLLVVLVLSCLCSAQQPSPDFNKARDEAVKFLGDLVKIDTSNPPGNETRAAEYI